MVDDANLIEQSELELWGIVNKMHKAGVRYEIIFGILQEMVKTLEMQGYCENWMTKYGKPSNT